MSSPSARTRPSTTAGVPPTIVASGERAIHEAVGRDDALRSQLHAGRHDRLGADVAAVADSRGRGAALGPSTRQRPHHGVVRVDVHAGGDRAVRPDLDPAAASVEQGVGPDPGLLADAEPRRRRGRCRRCSRHRRIRAYGRAPSGRRAHRRMAGCGSSRVVVVRPPPGARAEAARAAGRRHPRPSTGARRDSCDSAGDDRDARLLHALAFDLQAGLGAPLPHLLRRLAVRVAGREPVEVDVVQLVEGELGVEVRLADVPVEEALERDRARPGPRGARSAPRCRASRRARRGSGRAS